MPKYCQCGGEFIRHSDNRVYFSVRCRKCKKVCKQFKRKKRVKKNA